MKFPSISDWQEHFQESPQLPVKNKGQHQWQLQPCLQKIHGLLGAGVPEHPEIRENEKIPNSPCSVFFLFVLQIEYYFCTESIKMGLSKGFR